MKLRELEELFLRWTGPVVSGTGCGFYSGSHKDVSSEVKVSSGVQNSLMGNQRFTGRRLNFEIKGEERYLSWQ